ncbi:MAG: hypothetical protein ACI4TX_00300 [Christensenellales bacterium]
MADEKDLVVTKKRGRPKASETASKSTNSRPKANSTNTSKTKKGRPSGNGSKKAQIVAAATESANKANKAKSTSKSSISFDDLNNQSISDLNSNLDVNVESQTSVDANINDNLNFNIDIDSGKDANTDFNDINKDVNNETNIYNNADVNVDADRKIDTETQISEGGQVNVEMQNDTNESVENVAEKQVESLQTETKEEQSPTPKNTAENSDIDLTVDEKEIAQLQSKKKKKNKREKDSELNGAVGKNDDDNDLSSKKKKKKKWWLWLLLLLLVLCSILAYAFKDVLFPPKPIVIVPQGMVLDIKKTGTSSIGVDEFIFKPGDTIEFVDSLSVGSERTVEKEDGTKEELSPFTMRLRFFIQYMDEEYPAFIEDIQKTENASFSFHNGWYYWYDIVIPGAAYKKIIDSVTLTTQIGNEWKGREVSLVLEYQTITPTSVEVIEEAFEYDYDQDWAYTVTQIYEDYRR